MKLILENWKKFLIQEKMTNLVRYPDQDGWELYAKLVADAYREAPAFEERAQESFELLAPFYDKMHKRITRKAVKPRPVDYHPYDLGGGVEDTTSVDRLRKDYEDTGGFEVAKIDSEHPAIDDYNLSHEFIPLININGVKFSSKNFSIDLVLTQMMVMYPSEEFEQQVLIKTNKKPEVLEETRDSRELVKVEKEDTIESNELIESKPELIESNPELEESNELIESNELEELKIIESNELEESKDLEESGELVESKDLEESNELIALETNVELQIEETKEPEQTKPETLDKTDNQSFKYLTNANELTQIDNLDLNEGIDNTPIEIKTRDEIYLEIYKKAKKKAKEIRKNAIEAFLQAKNIKSKYNLDSLVESSSSEEEEEYI